MAERIASGRDPMHKHRFWLSLVVSVLVLAGAPTAQTPGQHNDADRAPFLNNYVGRYELTPTFILTVTRVGDALYVHGPGQSAAQMRPRSEIEFVVVGSGLQVMFGVDPISNEVDHLVFEQAGVGRRAAKLDGTAGIIEAREREVVDLTPEILQRYVGAYEEQPGFAITISLDDGRLLAGLQGQARRVVLPESETEFFYENSNARLSFQLSTDGEVERLIFHQGGSDLPMDRIRDE